MGTLENATKNAMLDSQFGTPPTPPGTYYVALFNGDPGSGGTEVTGGSYARKAVTNNSTNFPAASSGAKSNGVQIDFVTPTATWTFDWVALYDALSGGNRVAKDDLPTSRTALSGDPVYIPAGSLTLSL